MEKACQLWLQGAPQQAKPSAKFSYGGTQKLQVSRESQSAERGRWTDPACRTRETRGLPVQEHKASNLSLSLSRKAT